MDRFGLTAIDGGGKAVDTCKRIPRVFLPLAGGSQMQGYFTVSHDREGFHLSICLVAFACFVDKCIHVGWRESREFIMSCSMANEILGWGGRIGAEVSMELVAVLWLEVRVLEKVRGLWKWTWAVRRLCWRKQSSERLQFGGRHRISCRVARHRLRGTC